MKIRIGNTASCSMFPKQYEKFETAVSFEIEMEVAEEELETKAAEISEKIKDMLKVELDRKTAEYLVATEKIKKKISTALKNI